MNYLEEISNNGLKQYGNQKATYCTYKCKCGNILELRKTLVTKNRIKSCGCLKIEKTRELLKLRNTRHGLSKHPTYKKWKDMKARCYSVNNKEYKNYGQRGITVCKEWLDDFKCFYDWSLSNGYREGLTIDRIDVNGNYEPSNCRYVSLSIQARNKRMQINKTGFAGVYKIGNKYSSNISINNKKIYLGLYENPELAYNARKNYIKENKTGHRQ